MRKLLYPAISVIIILCYNPISVSQEAKDIKKTSVLYVGYAPGRELPPNSLRTAAGISDDRYEEDMRSRMGEFESLLKEYFGKVETVDARDYKEALSSGFDVTIFDGLPEPIRPLIHDKDPETGKTIRYLAPQYLSDGFSDAAVFIAQAAPTLGEPIRTKTDWYCMCLYSYAFEINREHPVFNQPLKVKIKMKKVETPPELFVYPTGKDLPPEIPMWQVQTESSKDGKGYRTGVVAHGRPFMEAPDCEYISGGQCMKEITAAAIARHGNFLHWGFAASPNYMTKEAKKAFVNAVYYMTKFKNRIPILRAEEQAPRSRSSVDYTIYTFSKEKYETDAESTRKFVKIRLEDQKIAKEKVAKGEELTATEKYALNFNAYEPETLEEYLEEKRNSDLVKRFGGSVEKTIAFLEENRPYFTGAFTLNREAFDIDAISLGIANNDTRILDAAIAMLEKGTDTEKALRILQRYTIKEFSTPEAWRKWYEDVKDKLFFSESGGYKFYVDSYNNPELYAEEIIGLENMSVPEPDDNNPVTSAADILPTIDGNRAVVIKVKMDKGFHIYSSAIKDIPFTFFAADIKLPEGMLPFGELRMPQEKPYPGDPEIAIFKGEIVLMQKITGESDKEIECSLEYQYCNDEYCGLPVHKTLKTNNKCVFELSVVYKQEADDILLFTYRDTEGNETKTEIKIKDGKGYFSAETCHPYWGRFNSRKYPANGGVLLDDGKITLTLDTIAYGSVVEGSALNDEYRGQYRSFRQDLNSESNKYINEYIRLRKEGTVSEDSLNLLYGEYYRYKRLREKEYIRSYPGSYYSLALARNMFHSSVAYKDIKEVYDLLSPEMQQTPIGQQLLNKVRAAKATMIGNMAPDIVLNDTEGEQIKLSDYRGSYVFLDFYKWGCPPCEDLMEALKPFHEKHKDKNLVILGIYHRTHTDLNESSELWKELLDKHSPTWTNLFDLDNKACDNYGIEAFPSSLLIDPDGRIIEYEISLRRLEEIITK
ncbi:MAG: redoxin domain-containing protein [Marinilabiliaceae bacterium]|jgi:peroxiredoxin|nr:redoxin domain-containing protein [Marinilabiliaceae bacterium]